MNKMSFFTQIEGISKGIIPNRLHPWFIPIKKFFEPIGYRRLTCIWFITWQCNFACPYCWQREEPETYRTKYSITTSDWLSAWERIANDFDEIVIGISGGEPFVVKGFVDMLSRFPDEIKYDITSNLSFDCSLFLSHEKIKRSCSGVICSFHPSNPSNRADYVRKFFEKVTELSILPNTRVNFVAAPPNLKYYEEVRGFCTKNKVPLHVDRYSPLKEGITFSPKEKILAEKILSSDRRQNPENEDRISVLCNGGQSHMVVFPDGTAWLCLKKAEKSENSIGNFLSDSFVLRKNWLRCNYYPLCAGCDFDNVKIKKISNSKK